MLEVRDKVIRPFSRHVLAGMAERKLTLLLPIAAILLLGVISSPPSAFADVVNCDGFFDSVEFDDIIVESGAVCVLHSVTVSGNIEVNPGGSLTVFFSDISGNIIGDKAKIVSVQQSFVNGNVQLTETTLFTAVNFNTINGNIEILISRTAVSLVIFNEVDGNIVFNDNFFGQSIPDGNIISANTVGGNLECQGNTSPPNHSLSDFGPNTVDGDKEGQCENL